MGLSFGRLKTQEEDEDKEKGEANEIELSRQLTEEHTKTANGAPISAVEPINSNERSTDENEDDSMNEKTPIIEEHTDSHAKFPGFHNIDLSIKRGEFIIVTGTIGSGKSSLLSAIAGSMVKTTGSVKLAGDLSYCGQPWVQNATVRDNISFVLRI